MVKLHTGDCVDVCIKSNTIVSSYKKYDEVKTFQIIATDKYGYYLYIPPFYFLKETKKADIYQCKQIGIDLKFLDEDFIYIQGSMVFRVSSILDGMNCCKCKEFFRMAQSNQADGTLICYSCRLNPYC